MEKLLHKIGIRHGREIALLSVPTVLAMLSHTLMWTVDSAFLGHVSSLALGAAGLGGLFTWTAYCMFNGLSRVSSTFVSQANGRGDDKAIGDYTWQGIWIALASGALLTILGQKSDSLLVFTGHSPEIQANTYLYIRIRTWSAVATQINMALSGFFQGRKDVKTPMWAGIIANGLNIVLDWLLIFGTAGFALGGEHLFAIEPMGIRGAAIATSVAVFLQAGILIVCFLVPAGHRLRFFTHRPRKPSLPVLRDLVRVGFPLSLGELIDMVAFSVFTALIGRRGAEELAASQITIQILSFSFMPVFGVTTAATVLVGNELGRGDPDKAERFGNETYTMILIYCLGLAAIIPFCGGLFFSIFSADPEVLRFAGGLALLAAVFQFFDGLRMLGTGILQGAGDTRFPTILAFAVLFGVFVPVSWWVTLARGGGVEEAWVVGTVSYFLMASGVWIRYRRGAWKRIDIFRSYDKERESSAH